MPRTLETAIALVDAAVLLGARNPREAAEKIKTRTYTDKEWVKESPLWEEAWTLLALPRALVPNGDAEPGCSDLA